MQVFFIIYLENHQYSGLNIFQIELYRPLINALLAILFNNRCRLNRQNFRPRVKN